MSTTTHRVVFLVILAIPLLGCNETRLESEGKEKPSSARADRKNAAWWRKLTDDRSSETDGLRKLPDWNEVLSALRDGDTKLRHWVACAIANRLWGKPKRRAELKQEMTAHPAIKRALISMLNDPSSGNGAECALYALWLGYPSPDQSIANAARQMIHHSVSAKTREVALSTLQHHALKTNSNVESIKDALNDPDEIVRQRAAREIAEMSDPPLVLLPLLSDKLMAEPPYVLQGIIPAVASYNDAATPFLSQMKGALERMAEKHPRMKTPYQTTYIKPIEAAKAKEPHHPSTLPQE